MRSTPSRVVHSSGATNGSMTISRPRVVAAANTSACVGAVMTVPSGRGICSETRNAWPVFALMPCRSKAAFSSGARPTKSNASTVSRPIAARRARPPSRSGSSAAFTV
jgi:hypothetical protein